MARGIVFQILAPLNLMEPWYSELVADGANLYGVCYMSGYHVCG